MIENKIIELLMKAAHGELSTEERVIIADFRGQSEENSQFVTENELLLSSMPSSDAYENLFDTNKALQKVNASKTNSAKIIPMNPPVKAKKRNNYTWLVAAAIAVFGLSTILFTLIGGETQQLVYSSDNDSKTILLTDGTEVTLNRNSTVKLSEDYGTNLRAMHLEGEAYFNVANIDNQPFTVKTGEIEVEVIGTVFFIRNRPSHEKITVYVDEGKVKVSNALGRTKVLLTEKQSANFDKSNKALAKDKIAKVNTSSWMTQTLSFNNMPLMDAISDIESHFDIDIALMNVDLEECPYTSLFNNPNPDNLLETLSAVFNTQIVKKGARSYQLMGGECQ